MNSSASANSRSPAASSMTRTSLPPAPPTQRPLSKPGPEIGTNAELAHALEQRLLHAQLAAEFDEGGDAVAQELGDRELRVEAELLARRIVVGAHIARIAADPGAFARHADLEERLAEIIAAPDVGDQPVRRAMAGMHVGIDEARRDELVARVDLAIDRALEALADEQHGVALVHELGIAPQRVVSVGMSDQPAAGDAGAHEFDLSVGMNPATSRASRRPECQTRT